MLAKQGILKKLVVVSAVSTLALLSLVAFVIIAATNHSQQRQTQRFVDLIKSEQSTQEELLRKGLIQKGTSLALVLAQNAAGLMENFDFESLQALAGNAASDPDVISVVFYDADGKPLRIRNLFK